MPFYPSTGGGGSGLDLVKRFVMFSVTTGSPVIEQASGVNSITDNGSGDYTVNFDAMPDGEYGALITGRGAPATSCFPMEQHDTPERTTTAFRVYTLALFPGPTYLPTDMDIVTVAILGT
jgi:hypothetical protein